MKFQNLTIRNFGSVKEMTVPLADQGMVLVLGDNQDASKADSNGSGKSLILDAFTWCLWGSTVRGLSHDDVVNEQEGKNCEVTVSFEEGGNSFLVRRLRKNKENPSLKPNDLVFSCNGEDACGVSIADTQARIDEQLGLDFVTFCAMMPGAGVLVSEMTDKVVKELLEKILLTEALGDAQKLVNEDLNQLKKEISRLEGQFVTLRGSIQKLEDQESHLTEEYTNFEDAQGKKYKELTEKIDRLHACKNRLLEEKKALNSWEARWEAAKKSKEEAQQKQKELQIKEQETLQFHQRLVNQLQKDKSEKLFSQKAHNKRLAEIREFGPSCSTCEQSIEEKHVDNLVRTEEEALSALGSQIQDISDSISREKDLCAEKIRPIQQESREYRKQEESAEDTINTAQEDRIAYHRLCNEMEKIVNEVDYLIERKTQISGEKNPYCDLLVKVKEEKVASCNRLTQLRKSLDKKTKERDELEFWSDGFAPSGLRSYMLEHVTPLLNQFTKKYADMITGGEMEIKFHTKQKLKNNKTKEKFHVQVSQKHGGSSYTANSKGERSRANLVIALALGDLAAMRASKKLPFRFLDEPFESIDEAGTDAIVQLLNQYKDEYETVFVITHQDYFKQLFNKHITVVKKDGFSYLLSGE